MAKARDNHLRKQAGEHLVCAKLAKIGILATPFAGNVPEFDIIAIDATGKAAQIQVKAASKDGWLFDFETYIQQTTTSDGRPTVEPAVPLPNPDLVYVCVLLDMTGTGDRFFVLKRSELQSRIVEGHNAWLAKGNQSSGSQWRYHVSDIESHENRWEDIFPG